MEWIRVSDRFPEVGDLCDVFVAGHGRKCNYEFEPDNTFYNSEYDRTLVLGEQPITHWCLVTYPPKD